MSYRDTYDSLCILLEEYADADIETVANQLLAMFGLLGEDLMEALDPPTGLETWLRQHGLSLIQTSEGRSPRVWEALAEADSDDEDDDDDLEEDENDSPAVQALPQVGDHVEYRTIPRGPSGAQQIGSGWVAEVDDGAYWVQTSPGVPSQTVPTVYIVPDEGDLIRVV